MYSGAVSDFITSVTGLCAVTASAGHAVQIHHGVGCSLVTKARNIIVANFLASEATHMLFLDADMGLDVDAAVKMLAADVDVIVAGYMTRNGRGMVPSEVRASDKEGLLECERAGTGVMMLSRGALERFVTAYPEKRLKDDQHWAPGEPAADRYYQVFNAEGVDGQYWGEDYRFCQLWRELQQRIYVEPTIRTRHHASVVYERSLVDQLRLNQAVAAVKANPEHVAKIRELMGLLAEVPEYVRGEAWKMLVA